MHDRQGMHSAVPMAVVHALGGRHHRHSKQSTHGGSQAALSHKQSAQHREHGGCIGPCVTNSMCVACKACRAHLAISKLFVQLSNLFEGCSLVLLQLPNLFLLGGQSILQGCLLLLVLLLVANC